VAVADVNGDGKPDLIAANFFSNDVSVLFGNGAGAFQATQVFAAGSSPTSETVATLTGNGIPDIITANQSSNDASVLLGNGDGTFQAPRTLQSATTRSR